MNLEQIYGTFAFQDEGRATITSLDQEECEDTCVLFFDPTNYSPADRLMLFGKDGIPAVLKERHIGFLKLGVESLSSGYLSLDASRPWLVFWIMHSLDLLNAVDPTYVQRTIDTLKACQHPRGGFGGAPGHIAHLAPTYAAVMALVTVGGKAALEAIDRKALYRWLMSLKTQEGGFCVHHDGEIDSRGSYLALAVASLCNILTPELRQGAAGYLLRCQTYEGGFGGEPGNEAHGGYNYCAVAALCLLGELDKANLPALTRWLCRMQVKREGGFRGRTNKLVDSCYSFWQGAVGQLLPKRIRLRAPLPTIAALEQLPHETLEDTTATIQNGPLCLFPAASKTAANATTLCTLPARRTAAAGPAVDGPDSDEEGTDTGAGIGAGGGDGKEGGNKMKSGADSEEKAGEEGEKSLIHCRRLQQYILLCSQLGKGGLRDKPSRPRDYYHTCYALSGLAVAQHSLEGRGILLGEHFGLLKQTSALYNVTIGKLEEAKAHFSELSNSHKELIQ